MAYGRDVISESLRKYIKGVYDRSRRAGRRLRDDLKEFILDLATLCIAYAPVPPNAPYSGFNYVNSFSMEADKGIHNTDKGSYSDWYRVRGEVFGAAEVHRLCSNLKTLPSVITVINDVESDTGYEYSYNVDEVGWSHTPPYRPILKAIKGALEKHPLIASAIDIAYSDGTSEVIVHKSGARSYIADFLEGDM